MLLSHFRSAYRFLSTQRTLVSVVVFATGIAAGTATALFSLFDSLMFRDPPYEASRRIMHLKAQPDMFSRLPTDEFARVLRVAWTTNLLSQRAIAGFRPVFEPGSIAVEEWGLKPAEVSSEFFALFGRPALGNSFQPADSNLARVRPLIVSDGVWRRHFGGSDSIVGTLVRIPGTPFDDPWLLVGVMPPGFDFPASTNVWVPYQGTPGERDLPTYVRLADGASSEQLSSALPGVTIVTLRVHLRPRIANELGLLVVVVTLFFLTAWAQAASVLGARTAERAADVGIRLALGASRRNIIIQIAVELGTVVALSWTVALLIAPLALAGVIQMLPASLTQGQPVGIDLRTLLFGLALSFSAAAVVLLLQVSLLYSVSPAILLRPSVAQNRPPSFEGIRICVLGAQILLTAALLYSSGVTLESLRRLESVDLGFQPEGLVAIRLPRVTPRWNLGRDQARLDSELSRSLYLASHRAVAAHPSVQAVAGAGRWPMQELPDEFIPIRPAANSDQSIEARLSLVTAGYVTTVGGRIIEGRDLSADDLSAQDGSGLPLLPRSALVNQRLASFLKAYGEVIGQEIVQGRSTHYRVVGVLRDMYTVRPDENPVPEVFVPAIPYNLMLVRVAPGFEGMDRASLLDTLSSTWPSRPPKRVIEIKAEVQRAYEPYRARMSMMSLVALACYPLAMLGILGAVRETMKQRHWRVYLLMALGARPRDLRMALYGRTVIVMLACAIMGLGAGLAGGLIMRSQLFGIEPISRVGLLSVVVLLLTSLTVAEVASRRLTNAEPGKALRH